MATVDPADGSEDVTEFLKRIKELGDKREKEDTERTRKLEEDILEGRKQREARRAERARSLSPEKGSPAGTPQSVRSSRVLGRSELTSSPLNLPDTPTLSANIGTVLHEPNGTTEASTTNDASMATEEPTKQTNRLSARPESPSKISSSVAVAPTRSGTLSWQQRPATVRESPSLSKPTNNPEPNTSSPEPMDEAVLSRSQIAQNLATKDPTWFRQTADRGIGSAAYRRNAEEGEQEQTEIYPIERKALHGMSRGHSSLLEDEDRLSSVTSTSASVSATTTSAAPSNESHSESYTSTFDRADRPSSPTKGMGGFVQSAMLKRSDSINKRWSAQNSPGVNRPNPIVAARHGLGGLPLSNSMPKLGHNGEDEAVPPSKDRGTAAVQPEPGMKTPNLPLPSHGRSESMNSLWNGTQDKGADIATPPSPSKRWSPVKSTWLESALNRPESPTPKPALNQPSWMVELNRSKQQRTSKDINDAPQNAIAASTTPAPKPKPVFLAESTKLADPDKSDLKVRDLQSSPDIEENAPSDSTPAAPKVAAMKTKPDTPPKKDFRSTLKARDTPTGRQQKQEPEFLSAFGKLKRTQTEKYVAPDTLKDNILRGKAGLSLTGGPQKTPRRDELKETLIHQRESMKAKAADPDVAGRQSREITSQRSVTPEAIAKKKALGGNESSGNIMQSPSNEKSVEQRSLISDSSASSHAPATSPPYEEPQAFQRQAAPGSKLADRFNPALASVLARRPSPGGASAAPQQLSSQPAADTVQRKTSTPEVSQSSGQLQHMTKARARGPKRRLPKEAGSVQSTAQATTSAQSNASTSASAAEKLSSPSKARNITPLERRISEEASSGVTASTKPSPKPQTPPKSSSLGKRAENSPNDNATAVTPKSVSPRSPPPPSKPSNLSSVQSLNAVKVDTPSPTPITEKDSVEPIEDPSEPTGVSVKNVSNNWTRGAEPSPSSAAKPPIKLPTQKDEEAAMKEAGLLRSDGPVAKPVGLGVSLGSSPQPTRTEPRTSRQTSGRSVDAAKQSSNKQEPERAVSETAPAKPVQIAPVAQSSDVGKLFRDFFDETPIAPTKVDVDTHEILSSDATSDGKIKTLRKSINEITNDGKLTSLPLQQEHVLFSNRMYLCTHVFGEDSGTRLTEVYLWVGEGVPDADVDDALLFARKAAKDNSAKLSILKQGKEPAKFFQALGGIVITRSGTSRENRSSYILCGRQHLGQLAFDEVQYSVSSLCSGFPYIIVAGPENVFLWKGSGCSAEELAGARLMSMDVGPSAKVTEVDEGQETPEFMASFSANAKSLPRSAEHWKRKGQHDNYKPRLFQVDFYEKPVQKQSSGAGASLWNMVRRQSQPDLSTPSQTQVTDIVPFCQADLQPENIYVLDAFFEIYIIIGATARSKARAFASALAFAQDYGIVAASVDNRPFVPVSTVVLEGAPRDMKAVFRWWDDNMMPASRLAQGQQPKRGKSLKVIPLSAAIAAVRG